MAEPRPPRQRVADQRKALRTRANASAKPPVSDAADAWVAAHLARKKAIDAQVAPRSAAPGPSRRPEARPDGARSERRPPVDLNDGRQSVADALATACLDGWRQALRAQATETGSEAISRQFAGAGDGDPDVRDLFETVAEFLEQMREAARQNLGGLVIAVGRAVGLPDWASETLGRIVVATAPLPLDIQLQVGAAATRVAGAFFAVEIAARDARAEPDLAQRELLQRLAADLGTIFAPFAELSVRDVRREAEVARREPARAGGTVAQLVGRAEAEALERVAEAEQRFVERAARAERRVVGEPTIRAEPPAAGETATEAPIVQPERRPEVRRTAEVPPPAPRIRPMPW
jgi:hypothetical protein